MNLVFIVNKGTATMRKTSFNPVDFFRDCMSVSDAGLTGNISPEFGIPTDSVTTGQVVSGGMPTSLSSRGTKITAVRCLGATLLILLFLLSSAVYAQTPAAPTGLTVTSTSETAVSLSWTAPAGEVDAYNVFRCEEGAQTCTPEWYIWLKGGATTTYTDDGSADPDADGTPAGLTAGATYRYAVLAIHYEKITTGPWPEHQSPWSNQVTALAEAQAHK